MEDAILSGQGNSRLLKTPPNLQINTISDLVALLTGSGLPVDMLTNPTGGGFVNPNTMKPLNKKTLFNDATATGYGLAGDNATPNMAFALLDYLTQYVWVKQVKPVVTGSLVTGATAVANITAAAAPATNVTLYRMNINIDASGKPVATGVTAVTVSYSTYSNANSLKGYYVSTQPVTNNAEIPATHFANNYILYVPSGAANATQLLQSSTYYVRIEYGTVKLNTTTTIYPKEVLFSRDENAYPKTNTVDTYYNFLSLFRDLPIRMLPSCVSGTVSVPSTAAVNVDVGFTPSAVVCQYQVQSGQFAWPIVFTGITVGAGQTATYYSNASYLATLTGTLTGFLIGSGQSIGTATLRYIAFR